MKWVTRDRIHVNRTATGWLIRRFLDPDAQILFVEAAQVAAVQQRQGAIGFDAPGARHPHKDALGRCSFEQLVAEKLSGDPALARLARIVHGADFPEEMGVTPESAGLWAISQGFTDVGADDQDILNRAAFLYDSLYAHLRRESASTAEAPARRSARTTTRAPGRGARRRCPARSGSGIPGHTLPAPASANRTRAATPSAPER